MQRSLLQIHRAQSIPDEWLNIHLSLSEIKAKAPQPGNDSNLLIVFYVQIMPDDFVMQLHR
ncbi:hypothetical protein MZF39_20200, partial [Escherichia coli]|nr:hypothetical protein [Escherichia coli]